MIIYLVREFKKQPSIHSHCKILFLATNNYLKVEYMLGRVYEEEVRRNSTSCLPLHGALGDVFEKQVEVKISVSFPSV
jgi:hypothetical protein